LTPYSLGESKREEDGADGGQPQNVVQHRLCVKQALAALLQICWALKDSK